jgi:8-oxo-dGTP pyrophosphatase MutT (NUDIX family)
MSDHDRARRSPWRLRATRQIYANPWISVEEDDVLKPSGEPGLYGRVCFRNLAVGIIPVDEHGQTWLVGQWRYPLQRYSWEIPMGGVPLASPVEDGARRELAEETGLLAQRLTKLIEVDLSNCVTDERGIVFLAEGLTPGPTSPDDTEVLELRRLPVAQAIAMAGDGRITDALSVIGLLTLARHSISR